MPTVNGGATLRTAARAVSEPESLSLSHVCVTSTWHNTQMMHCRTAHLAPMSSYESVSPQ